MYKNEHIKNEIIKNERIKNKRINNELIKKRTDPPEPLLSYPPPPPPGGGDVKYEIYAISLASGKFFLKSGKAKRIRI